MIATPASLRSDFIHIVGMAIHIAPECTNHITGIRSQETALATVAELSCWKINTCAEAKFVPVKIASLGRQLPNSCRRSF